MHLVYIPVVKTKDKEGNTIDKICARDFWRGRNSYRELQNDFHAYVTSKGFDLERGLPVEETGAKHQKIEELKKITNFENTKKVLDNIKLELPKVPDINDIKILQLNKAKVEKDIIKPKDDLINELYNDNKAWHSAMASSSTTASTKYLTLYTTNNKKGDATNETSGWNSDYSIFVSSSYPVFVRGGNYSNGDNAGVFAYSNTRGNPTDNYGFRVCLAF